MEAVDFLGEVGQPGDIDAGPIRVEIGRAVRRAWTVYDSGKVENVRHDTSYEILVFASHLIRAQGVHAMNSAEFRTGHVLCQASAASWPNAASWIALAALVQSPIIFQVGSGLGRQMHSHWATAALSAAMTGVFLVIGQAAVAGAMAAHLRGRPARLTHLLNMVLHLPAPLIRLAIAYGVAGGLLSLVPSPISGYASLAFGLVAYFYCSVAVPVMVSEQIGIIQALRRTVSLTCVHGAELIGIHVRVLMFWLVMLVPVALGVNALASPAYRGLILQVVITLVVTVSTGVVGTTIYRELRRAREGVELESMPSMPDAHIYTAA
jgi:hypothetical protein